MIYNFFDTETTGLGDTDEVIQIGGVITDESLKPIRAYCYNADTTAPFIHPKVTAINKLTLEILRTTARDIYIEQVLNDFIKEFYADDVIFCGYNVKFDIRMLNNSIRNDNLKVNFGKKITPPLLPKVGAWNLDVADYFAFNTSNGRRFPKLSNLALKMTDVYDQFISEYTMLPINSNLPSGMLHLDSHNSLYDSIITFLLFREQVWKKKLLL